MNKIVLEKLLHTYKLLDPNDKKIYEVEPNGDGTERRVFRKFAENFAKNWAFPKHIDFDRMSEENGIHWYEYFRSLANQIQQSQKFYVDLTGDILTDVEFEKIQPDIHHILPYKNCFFQFKSKARFTTFELHDFKPIENGKEEIHYGDETIVNMIVMEDEETDVHMPDGKIENRLFHIAMFPYDNKDNMFIFDPNIYSLKYHDDGSYTFWVEENPEKNYWSPLVDFSADSTGQYTNPWLNDWVQSASNYLCTFFAMMSFPQITKEKKVKGLSPRTIESPARYKFSELAKRPTWEHKTLVLDMYDRSEGNQNGRSGGTRSNGTAFHSVRKHLRRLSNGKHTFVKAHFRGSKGLGVVQKDYEVRT